MQISKLGHHVGYALRVRAALQDLLEGWARRDLWLTIGWYDIRKRYRRSLLGPFWITISLGTFIAALGFLYGPILGGSVDKYTPWIAFGFIAWQLISGVIIEGCNVFIVNSNIIQQLRAPLSVYIFQMLWRNLIIFAHNLLIYVFIIILFDIRLTWATMLIVPGMMLVCINTVSMSMLLGTLCARFRDIPPIVASLMQMMFLLTPILWLPERIPQRAAFVAFNPLYYFVEIIRQPLLGYPPPVFVWMIALAITLAGLLISIPFFSRFHDRIVYWL